MLTQSLCSIETVLIIPEHAEADSTSLDTWFVVPYLTTEARVRSRTIATDGMVASRQLGI